jgi:hypothetical protein
MVKFLVQRQLTLSLIIGGRQVWRTNVAGASRHVRTLVHCVGEKGTNLWSIERIFSAKTARTNLSSLLDQASHASHENEINGIQDSE